MNSIVAVFLIESAIFLVVIDGYRGYYPYGYPYDGQYPRPIRRDPAFRHHPSYYTSIPDSIRGHVRNMRNKLGGGGGGFSGGRPEEETLHYKTNDEFAYHENNAPTPYVNVPDGIRGHLGNMRNRLGVGGGGAHEESLHYKANDEFAYHENNVPTSGGSAPRRRGANYDEESLKYKNNEEFGYYQRD